MEPLRVQTKRKRGACDPVRQSCINCRKSKVKCSGNVPCDRCVRLEIFDTCLLWHRGSGRPLGAVGQAIVITPCPFYSDVFERVALQQSKDCTALSPAVKSCLDQYSRMLIMISITEQTLSAMHSGTKLAIRGNISLDDILPKMDSEVAVSNEQTPVSSLVNGSGTAWFRSLTPPVTPELQPAVEWANQLPICTKRSHDPQEFDDALYEVYTVIRGSQQFAELKSSITQCADNFPDNVVLSDNVPEFSETTRQQTQVIGYKNMHQWAHETRGQIMDQGKFRDQLLQSVATQLARMEHLTDHRCDAVATLHTDKV